MTAREAMQLIGKSAMMRTKEGLDVGVFIVDVRTAWGTMQVCVEPAAGKGTAWVDMRRLHQIAP